MVIGGKILRKSNVRFDEHAATRDSADGPRQLDGCCRNRALTDAHRDGFTCIPLLLEVADFPLLRWHHARNFLWQIDAGPLAESHGSSPFRDLPDSEPLCQGVKKHVAGLIDRFADIDGSMHPVL